MPNSSHLIVFCSLKLDIVDIIFFSSMQHTDEHPGISVVFCIILPGGLLWTGCRLKLMRLKEIQVRWMVIALLWCDIGYYAPIIAKFLIPDLYIINCSNFVMLDYFTTIVMTVFFLCINIMNKFRIVAK